MILIISASQQTNGQINFLLFRINSQFCAVMGVHLGADIKKAFDSTSPDKLAKVKVAGTLSEWFRVKKRVQQGCVLSPSLFNILAEMVMKETLNGFQGGLQIGGQMVTNICYADDIILLATFEAELQQLVDCLD